jgi:hypothetical protein
MKLICIPSENILDDTEKGDLVVTLYGRNEDSNNASAGATIKEEIVRRKFVLEARAWDLLSIALSVATADLAIPRDNSPDGWSREIELYVAVNDVNFWRNQKSEIEALLRFLTTDLWDVNFLEGGLIPTPPKTPAVLPQDSVVLLSGGLDSLIGAIDLFTEGKTPFAVSQIVRGDGEKQVLFARKINGGLEHLQLNHNAKVPGTNERSQRARSIIFLTYGVLAATALKRYHDGYEVPLYVCENGFISINPPLTADRMGSLSTRTAHPVFLNKFQNLLKTAGLHVQLINPYQFKTKGEMLKECADQVFLRQHAHISTSCGRFAKFKLRHCGRCVPCLIRRAAFHAWGIPDATDYVYKDLSINNNDHMHFDDVRSAVMGIAGVQNVGLERWLAPSLNSSILGDVTSYRKTIGRGIQELRDFFNAVGVI